MYNIGEGKNNELGVSFMNDEVTAEKLYADYKEKMYGYICNRIHNHTITEEIVAEIFVKIVKHIGDYDASKASPSTWVYVITRNTLNEYFRTRVDIGDIDEIELPMIENFEDINYMLEYQEILSKALLKLPDKMRDILIARYYYNYRFAKIGEMLGITEANARVTHARALEKIKEIMNEGMPREK